jgi:hypothetical protein
MISWEKQQQLTLLSEAEQTKMATLPWHLGAMLWLFLDPWE